MMIVFALGAIAQVKTYSTITMSSNPNRAGYATYSLPVSAADTLTLNQDTIQVPFLLNKPYPCEFYAKLTLDTIAGADTTVILNTYGKMFSDDSYSLIKTTTTAAIAAEASTAIETMTTGNYSLTIDSDSLTTVTGIITPFYRYVMFECIITDEDYTGSGVKLTGLELFVTETD